MTAYLPSAQERKGDEHLDEARTLRDRWKDIIPRTDLTSLQNRLTMLACCFLVSYGIRFDIHHLRIPGQRR
jgi:hypothetical protein